MISVFVETEEECNTVFLKRYEFLVPENQFSEFIEKMSIPEDFDKTIVDYSLQEVQSKIYSVDKANSDRRRILEIYTK